MSMAEPGSLDRPAVTLFGDTVFVRAPARLTEPEDGGESFVDTPLLVGGDVAHQFAESPGVDCANLLDQNPGRLTQQFNLRAERRGPGAQRRRRNQDYGARQQFVSLHDHSVAPTALLMADAPWRAELVDVTPQHACSP